ncbi:uncharacterized protein LOC128678018 isoform X2 [Plodia interpunctella]|uniref:uncharacterized protein LOC128678018 isoform X2 n=1 Tax=Plodia interpunctella TaxID=58824 RepID=UPI0023687D2F|nr:uncharacterized protein LOC128678018 isoform X2 [Plodia interpunctella]
MADSLFNIFGDHLTRQAMKNVSRQPLHNIENMGKTVSSGPVKPNEPLKKGEVKKSFLNNAGKALQLQGLQNNTPVRKPFTPRAVNVGSMIYNDSEHDDKSFSMDDLRFTKPTYKYVSIFQTTTAKTCWTTCQYRSQRSDRNCLHLTHPRRPPNPSPWNLTTRIKMSSSQMTSQVEVF